MVNLLLCVVAVIASFIIGGGIALVLMGIDDVVFIKNRYSNRIFGMETMDALRDSDKRFK